MKLRKIFVLLLALIMITGIFAGCGSNSSTTKDTSSNTPVQTPASTKVQETTAAKPVTVDIFQFKVEFKDAFGAAVEAFHKDNPNITINVQTVGGGEDYGAALKAKFNAGEEPAIFNIGGPSDVETWQAKLADVSETNAAKQALDGTLQGVTVNGKIYGIPYNVEGYGLIFNKKIFEKAGIDPASITTFDALTNAVKTIDSKKKDLGIQAVFAFPCKETWVTGLHLSNAFFSPEFDGDVMKAYNSKTVDFKYGDAMKAMIDLQNKYSVQPTASMDYSTQVEKLFSTGKVAMIQQGNWVFPTLTGIDADFAQNNIGMLPYPVKGFKEDSYPLGVPMYWAVNGTKSPEVQQAAKAFLDWLYTSDNGKKIVVEQFKFIPAYKGYSNDSVSDPLGKQLLSAANAGKTFGWVFNGYPNGWGMDKLGADVQLYVGGKLDWNKLIENEKKAWADARK
ncbi:MAG: extracellular solute-binding protein [Bacillota bacterium]|nr:extracellular solute-binding protein [Bacillota bacterium]